MQELKRKYLRISREIAFDSPLARFGGYCVMPDEIEWPENANGEKLTLVFSLPASFVNQNCGTSLPPEKFVSVFTTYNDDYFLDEVIDNGGESDYILENSFTKVLIHDKGITARNESEKCLTAYSIETTYNEDDGMSFMGGNPEWLQNDVEITENMIFCLQFYAGILPETYQNILYLDDAVGYLFIKAAEEPTFGYFFGQCT